MKVGYFQINWGFSKWYLGDATVLMGGTMGTPAPIRPPFTTHHFRILCGLIDLKGSVPKSITCTQFDLI